MRIRVAAIVATAFLGIGGGAYWYVADALEFDPLPAHRDNAETNTVPPVDPFSLTFMGTDGQPFALEQFRGARNVMLVFMRGYPGEICINCSAQTSRLIRCHRDFERRDTEILVVFPGPREHFDLYLSRSRALADDAEIPFRILLDPDFVAVDQLGIRGSLAKPSTYILDRLGRVRFAYVGAYTGDRPSIKSMLDQIDRVNRGGSSP